MVIDNSISNRFLQWIFDLKKKKISICASRSRIMFGCYSSRRSIMQRYSWLFLSMDVLSDFSVLRLLPVWLIVTNLIYSFFLSSSFLFEWNTFNVCLYWYIQDSFFQVDLNAFLSCCSTLDFFLTFWNEIIGYLMLEKDFLCILNQLCRKRGLSTTKVSSRRSMAISMRVFRRVLCA